MVFIQSSATGSPPCQPLALGLRPLAVPSSGNRAAHNLEYDKGGVSIIYPVSEGGGPARRTSELELGANDTAKSVRRRRHRHLRGGWATATTPRTAAAVKSVHDCSLPCDNRRFVHTPTPESPVSVSLGREVHCRRCRTRRCSRRIRLPCRLRRNEVRRCSRSASNAILTPTELSQRPRAGQRGQHEDDHVVRLRIDARSVGT